ncbi:unnamed protein product [Rhizophagus irregularis]|nr:unnamed protein product [Rhizophagus irregularis]
MNYEHIQNLSDDISNLRKDTSNCDVKIKVGEGPNSKEFMAHSLILSSRSVYFKKAFSEQWARKEDEFFISNQPNISPTVFEILINHIYSGTFSVDNNEISLVDILIASDELELLEIYRQLEKRLLENESAWKLPRDFITLCKHDHLTKLYQVAIELVCKNPKFIFKSKEFLNMEEEHLIQILKRDELKLEEIEIWDYLIEWGIENTDSISNDDLTEWSPIREGFNANKFHEYCDNQGPTVIIIKVRNSGEIIGGYNPLDWRSIKTVKDKKSKRVTSKPYIDHKCKTSNSFIFSLFSLTNGVIPILSRVTSKKEAIIWHENKGPCFGLHDLWIQSSSPQSRSGMSTQKSYEKKVINGEIFDIEEYEVFQIIDKRFSLLKLIKKMFNFSVKMYKKTEKTTRKKIDKKKMRREETYRFACRFDSDLTDYLIIK